MGQSADQVSRLGRLDATMEHGDEPEAIEVEIEQTRAEMSATVDAIQQRLNPEQAKESARELAEHVLEEAKEHAREIVQEASEHAREVIKDATAHVQGAIHDATIGRVQNMVSHAQGRANQASEGLMTTIKQNPVPAALAGIGLAWLWMNRRTASAPHMTTYHEAAYAAGPGRGGYAAGPGYGVGSRPSQADGMTSRVGQMVGGAASRVGDTVGGIAGQVGDTAGQLADQVGTSAATLAGAVGDTASDLMDATQERAGQFVEMVGDTAGTVEARFQQTMRTNPLAVGAVALAVGTAIGLALPQTQRENELMGEARDTLVEKVQDVAQEAVGKVQAVAGEAQETVKTEAQKQGLTQ